MGPGEGRARSPKESLKDVSVRVRGQAAGDNETSSQSRGIHGRYVLKQY